MKCDVILLEVFSKLSWDFLLDTDGLVFIFQFFFFYNPLLISSLFPLWSENILCMLSILLNLLRFVLLPRVHSVLENVLSALQKNVYSFTTGWKLLCKLNQVSWWYYSLFLYPSLYFIDSSKHRNITFSNYHCWFI